MTFRTRRILLAGGIAACALIPATLASAQDDVTRLDRIEIQGVGAIDGVVPEDTRAASKSPARLTEVPQSVSIVGRPQMDMQAPQKIDEALRYTPGVNPSTYGTDSDTDWLYIRGFQADQNGVFLDGLSFYQTGFGTFLMDPYFLERIEVVKGPSSVLYGGSNPGGFVNYVSKRPGERHRSVETGVNSWGNGYVAFDMGDAIDPDGVFSYRLNGKVSGGGWETDKSKDLRGMIAPSFKWQPDEDTSLTVLTSYGKTDLTHTSSGFLPYDGTVVPGPGGILIPRDFFYGQSNVEQYDRTQALLGYEFMHRFDNDWTVRQNLRYGTISLAEDGLYTNGTWTGTELNRYRFAHETKVHSLSIDNQLDGTVNTGDIEHSLLLGLDYRYYNHGVASYFGGAPGIDVLNPDYDQPLAPIALAPGRDTTTNNVGIYAQDMMRFGGGWLVTLNGRYDWVNTKLDNPVGTADYERNDEAFTGRVGIGYEFANGATPYVSYTTSFTPTLTDDGRGGLLEAEKAQQWEAGIKYEPTWMDGLFTLAYFDITRKNAAVAMGDFTSQAIGEVVMRGVEFSAQANLTTGTKVIGSLTYLDSEVTDAGDGTLNGAQTGKELRQVRDLTASLWVDHTIQSGALEGLGLAAGVRYLGDSWADGANTLKVPGVTLFDAAIRYKRDNWAVSLNAANLFDKRYVETCQGTGFFGSCGYGAGRTFTLKASATW